MIFRVIFLGDGCLFGFQYFPKVWNNNEGWDNDNEWDNDFTELNIYLLFICLHWKWFEKD